MKPKSTVKRNSQNATAEPSTRTRILEASRILFNQDGVQSTAMFRIASALSISPGNLAYHFPAKSDIVLLLAAELEQHIMAALTALPTPVQPVEVVGLMTNLLKKMWESRFFFNSALFVSRMDDDLAEKFQHVHGTICQFLMNYLERLVAEHEMRAPAIPDGIKLLTDNMVAVWMQWLRFEAINHPDEAEVSDGAIVDCLRHHFMLLMPCMGRAFNEALWAELDRRAAA